ncbi:unnamed protein product [Rhizophagus irregularis]|nr:unnamed protein product [Rhizophagus irregularis]
MKQSHKSDSHTNKRENGPFHLVLPPELEHAYEIEKNSKISTSESNRLTYLLECLRKYDEDNQTKISESSAKLQDTSSSSIKASNIPTEIVSSDSNESGKEQTSKISESSAKLQDTSSLSIKASNKSTEIVSSNSNESSKKEQTSKITELNTKLKDTLSLFIKASNKPTGFVFSDDKSDFRNKPTGFVSSDDESGKKDHQPSKKKSKMPEKSKKSSSIKASNKSTEVVSFDDESHQLKKNSKNSKKKSKSKKSKKQRKRKQSTSRSDSWSNSSSERTSGLETDSSSAPPRKVTYHSLTELPKDTKDNLRKRIRRTNMVRHLQLLDDLIVSKLKKSELNPIMLENAYHSPEESKVDSDNDSNENHIVIRDIK